MGCIPRIISETPKEKRYPFVKIMPGGSVARRLLDIHGTRASQMRLVDADVIDKQIGAWIGHPGYGDYYTGYDNALCAIRDLIADMPTITPTNEPLTSGFDVVDTKTGEY